MSKSEHTTITGAEFRAIRWRMRMSQADIARVLGYGNRAVICAVEAGRLPVTGPVARLMLAYDGGYRPGDWDDV